MENEDQFVSNEKYIEDYGPDADPRYRIGKKCFDTVAQAKASGGIVTEKLTVSEFNMNTADKILTDIRISLMSKLGKPLPLYELDAILNASRKRYGLAEFHTDTEAIKETLALIYKEKE